MALRKTREGKKYKKNHPQRDKENNMGHVFDSGHELE